MARERTHLYTLNAGAVSPLALGRTDLARMRFAAERYHNLFPKVIGPMQFRPGLAYEDSTDNNAVARNIPFIFSATDTALVELTDESMRVIIDGSRIARDSVSTTITNGNFSSGTGWTLTNADINTTVSGALVLQASVVGTTAKATRTFSVSAGDRNDEHGVRVTVTRGAVKFKLGSSSGAGDILAETELLPGIHSLAFTPGVATVYIEFNTQSPTQVVVDEAVIESSGAVEIPTPWTDAELFQIRYAQSGDVIFMAHPNHQPRRIERRAARSWSITKYEFRNGPWKGKTANISLDPSVRRGNGTMTSDSAFFTQDHVGAIFELAHQNTNVSMSLGDDDVYSDWVRISGVNTDGTGAVNEREVNLTRSGTWTGTLSLQTADDPDGPWASAEQWTTNNTAQRKPGAAGQITYVRIGFLPGDHTSGTASVSLSAEGGGGFGIVRVTGYNSPTSVNIEVLERLHSSLKTQNWREGKYSDAQGWPSSVELFEGRLWWGSADQLAGSVSDDFTNFSTDEEGDSGPIIRAVATGPVNRVQWLLGLARLCIGTTGAEPVARSSSFDEPMTPTNFSIKDASTYGSADIQAVKVDRSGIFVSRSAKRAYALSYSVEAQDYATQEISRFNPTILNAGVKIFAVQRQPDTRIWFVMNDGTCCVLTYEPSEDVLAWTTFETEGTVEDVCVLPNEDGDDVFFIVNRTIGGLTRRYRERLAYETNAEGGTLNRMADSYKVVTLSNSATVTGLSHLNTENVVVWQGDGPLLTDGVPTVFTVSGNSITLPQAYTGDVVVGLYYEGFFKSAKLAYAAQSGTAVTQRKIITYISPLLYKTHLKGIRFGQDFETMDYLPEVFEGEILDADTLLDDYDTDGQGLPGEWKTDARLCMKFTAPMPATVLGIVLGVEAHERG